MIAYKKFKVCWSNLDANGHMANTTYQSFTAHARLQLIEDQGVSISQLLKEDIGSMLFHEHTYYFKEFMLMETLKLSTELTGLSEDRRFFKFRHNFYKESGQHAALSEVLGAWIDLKHRRLLSDVPPVLSEAMDHIERSEDFKVITKEDTRSSNIRPKDLKKEPYV